MLRLGERVCRSLLLGRVAVLVVSICLDGCGIKALGGRTERAQTKKKRNDKNSLDREKNQTGETKPGKGAGKKRKKHTFNASFLEKLFSHSPHGYGLTAK